MGSALGVDPLRFVLTGGDDYSLLATFPHSRPLPERWLPIGRVTDEHDAGTVLVDGSEYPEAAGHQHFVGRG